MRQPKKKPADAHRASVDADETDKRRRLGSLLAEYLAVQIATGNRETARRALARQMLATPHGWEADGETEALEQAAGEAFEKADRRLRRLAQALDACTERYQATVAKLSKPDAK